MTFLDNQLTILHPISSQQNFHPEKKERKKSLANLSRSKMKEHIVFNWVTRVRRVENQRSQRGWEQVYKWKQGEN